MKKKAWLCGVAVAWAASLFGVGLWAQGLERNIPMDGQTLDPATHGQIGTVITGDDFGFRLGGVRGNQTVTGTVVVRLGGEWFDVTTQLTLRPVSGR